MYGVHAQVRSENYFARKWLFDLNTPIGFSSQQISSKYTPDYSNYLNSKFSNLKLSPGQSVGIDLEFGCYFGKLKSYGFGTGVIYQLQSSQISLDNFHIEYKATDAQNSVFRQVVTASNIAEKLNTSTINIPLVFKLKQPLTKKIGYSVDGGLLLSISNATTYNSNAAFDYEAIYSYSLKANDAFVHVYDNNPTPVAGDWLITKAQYESHNPTGNVNAYFDSLAGRGYNVGLGVKPTNRTGSVSIPAGSLGFIFRPAVNIKIFERLYCYFGGYFSYQIISTDFSNNFSLTSNMGKDYNSLLNAVSKINQTSIGANIGLRVFLGHSSVYIETEE